MGYDNTNPNPDPAWNLDTAHDMGHVFGLEHEHQRLDRDLHVYFNCAGLAGYDRVKGEIEDHPEWGFTIEDACDGFYYGQTHGLNWIAPGEFTTNMGSEGMPDGSTYHYVQTFGWTYDHESIMQYHSRTGCGKDPNCGVTTCPLVRWKVAYPPKGTTPTDVNAELIWPATEVTEEDAAGIRKLYPWLP